LIKTKLLFYSYFYLHSFFFSSKIMNRGFSSGADPGIPLRVGGFCILISNFNIYNTKKGQKPKYIVHINKK
jgi:hypothetical protein